jgi:hypothetical protein
MLPPVAGNGYADSPPHKSDVDREHNLPDLELKVYSRDLAVNFSRIRYQQLQAARAH